MKRGLVLEGGGAKGAFHCGAVQALYDNGYTFNGVAGTSIGAINAALIAQDGNYDSLLNMWTHVTASLFTDFDDLEVEKLVNGELSKSTIGYWSKQVIKIIRNLGIPTDKIIPFLKEYISEDRLRVSKMDLALVTYSLTDRAPVELFLEDIPCGELHNYILASAYYPAFKLNKINGKYFIDGGVCDNMPIGLLSKREYEEIIAVRTMSKMPYHAPNDDSVTVHYICPSETLGKTLALSHKLVERNIKLGYFDALRFIRGYAGEKFYLKGTREELAAAILDSSVDNLENIGTIFNLAEGATQEDIAVRLLNFVMKAYEGRAATPIDGLVMLAEEYALFYGVEKFQIYTPNEFLSILRKNVASRGLEEKARIKFLMREKIRKDNVFCELMKDKRGENE